MLLISITFNLSKQFCVIRNSSTVLVILSSKSLIYIKNEYVLSIVKRLRLWKMVARKLSGASVMISESNKVNINIIIIINN